MAPIPITLPGHALRFCWVTAAKVCIAVALILLEQGALFLIMMDSANLQATARGPSQGCNVHIHASSRKVSGSGQHLIGRKEAPVWLLVSLPAFALLPCKDGKAGSHDNMVG